LAEPAVSLHAFRASDGYLFYYRRYAPEGKTRARLVFVHGIRSHGGWYERSCRTFAEAGYELFFLDRRGGGLNTAHRGDTPNFRRLLDDIGEFIREQRYARPWLPTILAGISWGGKLAVGLPYRSPGLIDGLVLLCPGLAPRVTPPFLERIAIARARVRRPQRLFPIPLNEPELFTGSPEWQRYIAEEPHGIRQATARFLFGSFSLDIYLRRAAKRIQLPTLLLLAEHDRIIDNARTRAMVEGFPTMDRSIREYVGAHHTLEFEQSNSESKAVHHPWMRDALEWLGSRW
jgi:alpha-beta hydrolase superfamily lysophospholipase